MYKKLRICPYRVTGASQVTNDDGNRLIGRFRMGLVTDFESCDLIFFLLVCTARKFQFGIKYAEKIVTIVY